MFSLNLLLQSSNPCKSFFSLNLVVYTIIALPSPKSSNVKYDIVEAIDNFENGNLWYESGVLRVKKDGKYGLINYKGEELLKCEYNKIESLKGVTNSLIIEKDGIAIGFSGDSAMCNNLHKIICKTKAAFVDCSAISVNNKHLSVEEFFSLKKSYPLCQMIPVHMSIYSEKELLSNNISVPFQGKIIEIV